MDEQKSSFPLYEGKLFGQSPQNTPGGNFIEANRGKVFWGQRGLNQVIRGDHKAIVSENWMEMLCYSNRLRTPKWVCKSSYLFNGVVFELLGIYHYIDRVE